jgi:hypothetical protein
MVLYLILQVKKRERYDEDLIRVDRLMISRAHNNCITKTTSSTSKLQINIYHLLDIDDFYHHDLDLLSDA